MLVHVIIIELALNLCAEVLVTVAVSVSVPLGVDIFVRGDIDDLGLDIGGLRCLDCWCRRDGSGVNLCLGILRLFLVVLLGAGRSRRGCVLLLTAGRGGLGLGLGLGLVRRFLSWSLAAAHVEVEVRLEVARLGLTIIGVDVGHLCALGGAAAAKDRADLVENVGEELAILIAALQVESFLLGRAVTAGAVDV